MSGDLGVGPSPVPQPMGSLRPVGPASQQQAQQKGPSPQPGVRPTGPQQQKLPGAQVSGPLPHTKQGTPQSKGSTQPSPAKTAPTHPATKTEIRKQEQNVSRKQMSKTEKEGDTKTPRKGAQDVKDQKKSSEMQKSKHHDVSDPLCPHCLCTCPP